MKVLKTATLMLLAVGACAIDIPQTNCDWRGADNSVRHTCDGNEIPVAVTKNDLFQLWCSELVEVHVA